MMAITDSKAMNLLLPFAKRFVAGRVISQAIPQVRKLNQQGVLVTLDILGEDVTDIAAANQACEDYLQLVEVIEEQKLKANVSLKLSQMGLTLDAKLAHQNLVRILATAKRYNNFVRIDMEGTNLTQKTLDCFWELRQQFDNVGIVVQAYLHRTEADIQELIKHGGSVRLCKGAYREPADLAFQNMGDIRANYIKLMTQLFEAVAEGKPVHPAIATHDDILIRKACELAKELRLPPQSFELQMLYGLRRKLGVQLANEGYKVRSYVPYGDHWFPYFYRRLRERKENVFFIVSNLFKD
jgi:proline dehydrogenase